MKYLLDTNILSYLEEQSSPFHAPTVAALARLGNEDEICIPVLTLYELRYSVSVASQEKAPILKALIASYLDELPIQQLTEDGAESFGTIKARYRAHHPGINQKNLNQHNIDFIIASSAIAENATLVSNDNIFKTIHEIEPALHLENWAEWSEGTA